LPTRRKKATPPIIHRAAHSEALDSRFSLRSICRLFRSVSMFETRKQKLERFCHSAAVGRNRNKILCVLHAFQVLTRSARSTSVNSVLRPLAREDTEPPLKQAEIFAPHEEGAG